MSKAQSFAGLGSAGSSSQLLRMIISRATLTATFPGTMNSTFGGSQLLIMVVDLGHILCPSEWITGYHLQGGISAVPSINHSLYQTSSFWVICPVIGLLLSAVAGMASLPHIMKAVASCMFPRAIIASHLMSSCQLFSFRNLSYHNKQHQFLKPKSQKSSFFYNTHTSISARKTIVLHNNTELINLSSSLHYILSSPCQHCLSAGQMCLPLSHYYITRSSHHHPCQDYLFPLLYPLPLLQCIFHQQSVICFSKHKSDHRITVIEIFQKFPKNYLFRKAIPVHVN